MLPHENLQLIFFMFSWNVWFKNEPVPTPYQGNELRMDEVISAETKKRRKDLT